MRQKVGVAIAIAKDAKVLLLDEPTSGLDPKASNDFADLLEKLSKKGIAILTEKVWERAPLRIFSGWSRGKGGSICTKLLYECCLINAISISECFARTVLVEKVSECRITDEILFMVKMMSFIFSSILRISSAIALHFRQLAWQRSVTFRLSMILSETMTGTRCGGFKPTLQIVGIMRNLLFLLNRFVMIEIHLIQLHGV